MWRLRKVQEVRAKAVRFKLDHEIHRVVRVAGAQDGVGLRSDCEIGIGREEGIEKFIVWRIVVIFTGIGRDSAESFVIFEDQGAIFCQIVMGQNVGTHGRRDNDLSHGSVNCR